MFSNENNVTLNLKVKLKSSYRCYFQNSVIKSISNVVQSARSKMSFKFEVFICGVDSHFLAASPFSSQYFIFVFYLLKMKHKFGTETVQKWRNVYDQTQ